MIKDFRWILNGNVQVINAILKFLLKVFTQKGKLNNQVSVYTLKSFFKSALWFCLKIKFLKISFIIFVFFHIDKIFFHA